MASELANMRSMRDINDYCVARGIMTLAQGMIELPPPEALRRLGGEALMRLDTHCYRNRKGEPDFVAAVEKLLRSEGVVARLASSVLATQGVTGAFVAALLHLKQLAGRSPTVLLLEPFYTYHLRQIKTAAGTDAQFVKLSSLKDGKYAFSDAMFAEIEAKLSSGEVDGVVMCNPVNPTGQVWAEASVRQMMDVVAKYPKKLLICDECYNDMVFDGHKHVSPIHLVPKDQDLPDSVVVCRGFSKSLGAQSWRVGYAVSSPKTSASMMDLSDPIYICTPILQHAVADFLTHHEKDFDTHIVELNKLLTANWVVLKEAFVKKFGWSAVDPSGTMYGNFIHDCSSDLDAVKLALQAGVGVCPGSMFTREGINATANTQTIRIHCGISAEKARKIAELLTQGL
ncbi:Aspartate aminotransferase [Diplonema papillatum]|nr:Aspartate aminotransferase [Diplonema papillatum]|eukprot:gene3275-5134_t